MRYAPLLNFVKLSICLDAEAQNFIFPLILTKSNFISQFERHGVSIQLHFRFISIIFPHTSKKITFIKSTNLGRYGDDKKC